MKSGFSAKYLTCGGLDNEINLLSREIAQLEARTELSPALQRTLRAMKANRELALARRDASNARRKAR